MSTHWTARSIEDYRYSVISSFLMQIERELQDENISRKDYAKRLKLTQGRVSQILNGQTDNFSIEKVIEYAKALGMDVSVVAYKTGSPNNRGPIHPEVFSICWERLGRPLDHFDLNEPESIEEATPSMAGTARLGGTALSGRRRNA